MKSNSSPKTQVAGIATIIALSAALLTPVAANATLPADPNLQQASLGDSITRGSAIGGRSSSGGGIHNPAANWSTGTDSRVNSHLQRLAALKGVSVTPYNFSVGGTTSSAIAGQAGSVSPTVDYTTILTGGNDICQANTVAELPAATTYKANVKAGIDVLLAKNPNMVVGLGSVPSIKNLYEVGKTNTLANVYHRSNQICPVGLGTNSSESTTQANARRAAVDTRVQSFNTALAELAADYPTVYFDNNAIYNTQLSVADISTADYFHPSYSGHQKIAKATWDALAAQGAYDTAVPVVKPTVQFVSSTTVSGTAVRATVKASSDTRITSVKIFVPRLNKTVPLYKGANGDFVSPAIDTTVYSNGTFPVEITAIDTDADSTTVVQSIRINN